MAQRRTERMTEKLNLSEKQSKQLYEVNLQDSDAGAGRADARIPQGAGREDERHFTPEQFEQWSRCRGRVTA
ncbi:MAG: DUF4890 domain-containing protein [Alistipes finegoldii]